MIKQQHIHILGICGTFMGSLAVLARQKGLKVTGADADPYPPMSTYLASIGVDIYNGYDIEQFNVKPDLIVIGNTIKRGNIALEYILNSDIPYTSGPEWLYDNILFDKHVIAISGTHGKTTTTSMITKILEYAGTNPSFLIGGIAQDFKISSRLTDSKYFVIEADEYDTIFYDKRPKFMHYRPSIFIINNLEFDHADIFTSLDDIKRQFHHMIRSLPSKTKIIYQEDDENILSVLKQGCWSEKIPFGKQGNWYYRLNNKDGSFFEVYLQNQLVAQIKWDLIGIFNILNAMAAIITCYSIGIPVEIAAAALTNFKGVKRRLEKISTNNAINIYDDFAHHPTAIGATVNALRAKVGEEKIYAILEPRTNTMKLGTLKNQLVHALKPADEIFIYQPEGLKWSIADTFKDTGQIFHVFFNMLEMEQAIIKKTNTEKSNSKIHLLIMSNGEFAGIHHKLVNLLN